MQPVRRIDRSRTNQRAFEEICKHLRERIALATKDPSGHNTVELTVKVVDGVLDHHFAAIRDSYKSEKIYE